jgi:hypothetical protein
VDGEDRLVDRLVPVSPHGRRVLDLAGFIIGNGQPDFWLAMQAADVIVSALEEQEERESEEDA